MTTAKYASLFPPVAPRWRELLCVQVHGAANLPIIDGQTPLAYVTAQTKVTMTTQEVGSIVNATNVIEGVSPQWNEIIYIEISEDMNRSEDLILLVLDKRNESQLAEFQFPWRWFEPFYQYHFNLEYPSEQTGQTVNLFVSMILKKSALSNENNRYYGLESLLHGFDGPITIPQAIYAVARIVPNYKSYKHDYLVNPDQSQLGIPFQKVSFASSEEFRIPEFSQLGYPQLSVASKLSKTAVWKYDFFFTHPLDKDNMFTTRGAALVIEFYPYHPIANHSNWRIAGLLGWVAVLLDQRSYDALTSTAAGNGLRTDGLMVESEGDLTADSGKYLTASLALRLIMERHPAKNLLYSNQELPILPSYQEQTTRQNSIDPVYKQASVSNRTHLPAIKSVREATPPIAASSTAAGPPTFLPPQFYQPPRQEVIQSLPLEQSSNPRYNVPRVELYDMDDLPTEYRAMLGTHYPPRRDDDIDGWFDYFQRMTTVYKQAFRRVVHDVIQLREQHKSLTNANQELQSKVDKFGKKTKVIADVFESDKLDRNKIEKRYADFKKQIVIQSAEITEKKALISKYEQELAQRDKLRVQYDALLHTLKAREAELKLVKERITRADVLEERVREQQLHIAQLEKVMDTYIKPKLSAGRFNNADLNFLRENARRRFEDELQADLPSTRLPDAWQPSATSHRSGGLK